MTQVPDDPQHGPQGGGSADSLGGFDLGAVLQQAQAMQEQLVRAQEQLAQTEVTGTAGGVEVTLDGTGGLSAVTIPPGTAVADDEESWTDLGDLVVAAYRDAKSKADDLAAQALGPLAGGMGAMGGDGGLDLGGLLGGGSGGAQPGGDDPRRLGF